jgi:hypothetical protein
MQPIRVVIVVMGWSRPSRRLFLIRDGGCLLRDVRVEVGPVLNLMRPKMGCFVTSATWVPRVVDYSELGTNNACFVMLAWR